MTRTRTSALLTLAALAAAMLAGGLQQKEAAGTPPLVQWCGHETKARQTGFVVMRAEDDWQKLWSAHTGGKPEGGGAMARHTSPKIDFAHCCVVGYFRGTTTNRDGEVCESVADLGDHVRVRFESWSFQTASMNGDGGAQRTTPFGLWVIPATDKPIVVEEATRVNHLKSDPITWKEVHRFPARK